MAGLCSACSGAGPPVGTVSSGTAVATATAGSDPLAGCPASRPLSSLPVFARVLGDDDDLAAGAAGSVWMSQPLDGRLLQLDSTGRTIRSVSDPDAPEGIAVLADGSLLVADQRTNRVERLPPGSDRRTPFAGLPGPGGTDTGVDGIALDSLDGRVLVPDSPAGSLLAYPQAGGSPVTLATGLGRAVSAARLPGRGVLVAEENLPGLVLVGSGGSVTPVAAGVPLRSLDEVLVSGGIAYVTDLAAHSVDAVDPVSGRVRTLVSAAPAPQGLALLPDGRLLISDSTRQLIAAALAC